MLKATSNAVPTAEAQVNLLGPLDEASRSRAISDSERFLMFDETAVDDLVGDANDGNVWSQFVLAAIARFHSPTAIPVSEPAQLPAHMRAIIDPSPANAALRESLLLMLQDGSFPGLSRYLLCQFHNGLGSQNFPELAVDVCSAEPDPGSPYSVLTCAQSLADVGDTSGAMRLLQRFSSTLQESATNPQLLPGMVHSSMHISHAVRFDVDDLIGLSGFDGELLVQPYSHLWFHLVGFQLDWSHIDGNFWDAFESRNDNVQLWVDLAFSVLYGALAGAVDASHARVARALVEEYSEQPNGALMAGVRGRLYQLLVRTVGLENGRPMQPLKREVDGSLLTSTMIEEIESRIDLKFQSEN